MSFYSAPLSYQPDASRYYAALADLPWAVWLDSGGMARYDILVAAPHRTLVLDETEVQGDPFVMRLASMKTYRQPDLQVILKSNPGQLTETGMIGPADICIEVVSPGSEQTDYGEKFVEYEAGGVPEYWLFDSLREQCFFYRLDDNKRYKLYRPDDEGNYSSPALPGLRVHVPTLWRDQLPTILEVVESVRQMVAGAG